MQEYLDLLDEHGNLTGKKKSRFSVHQDGDWHRAIAIFVLNNQNEILFQKRSASKDSLAGMWASSIFGHVETNQTSIEIAHRELKEEIGIIHNAFKELGTVRETKVPHAGYIDNVFVDVYLVKINFEIKDFIIQEEELSKLKWVPYNELKIMLQNHDVNLVDYSKVHDLLIKELGKN